MSPVTTLCRYTGPEGERELVLIAVPDEPVPLVLLDAATDPQTTDDVIVVDDELTTLAEARMVAAGYPREHDAAAQLPLAAQHTGVGAQTEVARYVAPDGEHRLVAQRNRGEVCLIDLPQDDEGKVRLVERGLATHAELTALVTDYVAHAGVSRCLG